MTTVTAMETRRSIRKYKPDIPVTKEQQDKILRAAMISPSAGNSRPWEFIVVTKREILVKIPEIHEYAKMFATAPMAIIVVGAPSDSRLEAFWPQDCGAVTQSILLEAAAMGLGTCWCGVHPVEERVASFKKLLGISEGKIPFCVIAVGVPDEAPEQRGFFEDAKVTYIV